MWASAPKERETDLESASDIAGLPEERFLQRSTPQRLVVERHVLQMLIRATQRKSDGECEEEEGWEDDNAPDQRQPCAFVPIQSSQLRDAYPGGWTGGRSCSRLGRREEGPEEEGQGPTGVATRRGAQTTAQAQPDTPETEREDEPCPRGILQLSQRERVLLMGEG